MKKLTLLILSSSLCLILNAQDVLLDKLFSTNSKGEIEIVEIVDTNTPCDILYSNAKKWVAVTFKDYKKAIQIEDASNYTLVINCWAEIPFCVEENLQYGQIGYKFTENITFCLTIDCKNNRYRYTINDVNVHRYSHIMTWIMGVPVPRISNKNMSPLQNLADMKHYNEQITPYKELLKSLYEKDISLLNKREQKQHQKNVSDFIENHRDIIWAKIYLDLAISFYQSESQTVASIISSLKDAMVVNYDF